jgi:CBS domain containing-hemolysin-like protein
MEIKDILRTLQKNRTEIAITIDEYGGTSGIITTEDIIEEIVGEITDEFDDDQKPLFQENNNNETSIDAQLLIKEVNEHFNLNIEDEENHTIGGWVFSKLQQIPQIGAKVFHPPYSFTVQEMTERKISRLLVGICNTSSKTTQIKNE